MLFSGVFALPAGVLTGTLTFSVTLSGAPQLVLPVVQNISGDSPKLTISAWVSQVTAQGFTWHLDMATNSTNYQLVYLAGDPSEFNTIANFGLPECTQIAIGAQFSRYCSCHITEWDVRKYVSDHELTRDERGSADLDFAPSTIAAAMESAAREYNGVPPYTNNVQAKALPKQDNSLLDAIAYFLYLGKLQEEQRHDTPYSAGNVNIDVSARRVQHYSTAVKFFYDRFFSTTKQRKQIANARSGYARVG